MTTDLEISDAWKWVDALSQLKPRRMLLTRREDAKYAFFSDWEKTIVDAISDGRPLLMNFHVGGTFVVGTKTPPGARIYNNLFEREGKRRKMLAAVQINAKRKA
jgi:hypothetical protein